VLPLAALAGCSADGTARSLPSEVPTGSPSTPAVTTTPAASPADQVRSAYLRYWAAVVAAHRAADPRSPALAAVAADPQLSEVRTTIERNRLQQISLRGEVTHRPGAVRVSGGSATVEDCYDLSAWNPVSTRTGEAIDVTDENGTGRHRARFTLRRSGAAWVVTTDTILGSC
jgi:hypothetical protein